MRPIPAARRRGFTLFEVLIAMTITALVMASAVTFFRKQSHSVAATAAQMDAVQNARFAQNSIDRDLRMVGVGTLDRQPMLVQAGPYALTFNAALYTRDASDIYAVYLDADADSSQVTALQPAQRITLPGSTRTYPDSAYLQGDGTPGRASTISYWVSRDSSSPRPNEYVLFKRINDLPPRVVTTGISLAAGEPFFRFLWLRDTTGAIDTVPAATLPLYHTVASHDSPADTGETRSLAAQIDRIRIVRMNVHAVFRDPSADTVVRRNVQTNTQLMNVGLLARKSCGQPPSAPGALSATLVMNPADSTLPDHVHLTWTASADEAAGELDVQRYVLYRHIEGGTFGDAFADIPASGGTYGLDDADVRLARGATGPGHVNHHTWSYGVSAQDCQPQLSGMTTAVPVVVPTVP